MMKISNKDLYNQLNQIPEIEAIQAISIEEDIASESEKESSPLSEFFSRVYICNMKSCVKTISSNKLIPNAFDIDAAVMSSCVGPMPPVVKT